MPDTLLAFDTSTECMAVAVQTPRGRFTEDAPGGAAASAALLPTLQALLERAGAHWSDVAAVGFGRGPGAFTGLRTSCAVAQGLALGLGCPVVPVDSLLIVAEQARRHLGGRASVDLGVAMDARMGETYAGRYLWQQERGHEGHWQALQSPGLWAPEALDEAWAESPPQWCTGSALDLSADALLRACPPPRRVRAGHERAAALIALVDRAWREGAGIDAAQALPLYLRDKVALTTAERAAAAR
ncbi:MAG: tRNA (adenosine(37)-N6)-threonylcarbamoyltransferase complex dimerization subunit type 1 TsaB [Burkholderiales bacterium]|nr:tRNA (adenosine(37)-N6)-threonylcarbamoyltransferase complex dimerization subunit type 1 TsaB [Burkholderiales bacterium]